MKTVKKVIRWIVIALVVILIAAVAVFTLFGNRAIKAAIETAGSKTLKVAVTLEDINLSLLGGSVEMKNLVIANPAGYAHKDFLTMGRCYAKLNAGSLLSNTIEIKTIELDKISVVIEQKNLTTNNLQEILAALPKPEKTDQPQPAPQESKTGGKNLLIKKLQINEATVQVKLLPVPGKADTISLALAPISIENIGSAEKVDTAKLTAIILKAIAEGVAQKGKDLLPLDVIGPVTEQLTAQGRKLLEAGEKGVGTALETGKGVIEGGKDVGQKATDAIKGLFEKKKTE